MILHLAPYPLQGDLLWQVLKYKIENHLLDIDNSILKITYNNIPVVFKQNQVYLQFKDESELNWFLLQLEQM